MTIYLTLGTDPNYVLISIRGTAHRVNDDNCDCTARSFGNVCSHLKLLHGLGGFDKVRGVLEKDERARLRAEKRGISTSCETA